jgi:hypothetical protein
MEGVADLATIGRLRHRLRRLGQIQCKVVGNIRQKTVEGIALQSAIALWNAGEHDENVARMLPSSCP